ncbi:MAG TPA: FecR domain-containing protein [Solimonas sp.]
MSASRFSKPLASALLGLLLLPLHAIAADSGRVMLVEGGVLIERDAQESRIAERGMVLAPGDRVTAAVSSRAQLWMEDDAVIALTSPSSLKIERYDARSGTAEYRLEKGGARVVSGSIKPLVHTPMGEVKAIGTDFTNVLCSANCSNGPGLYIGVNKGQVKVSNGAGSVDVGAGQFAYAASPTTAPILISAGPSIRLMFADVAFQIDMNALELGVEVIIQPTEPPGSPS